MNFPPFATDFDTFNFTREVVIYILLSKLLFLFGVISSGISYHGRKFSGQDN